MRIAFAGTPRFAELALGALIAAGHQVPLVLTQPDKPAGRGLKLTASPVKQFASEHRLAVFQPASLRDPAAVARLRACAPEIMVVAAYGLLLPQEVLDIPLRGCLNIHASLLPRWRGAAPIQRAILAGDRDTGITIMRMEAGLDSGPILDSKAVAIRESDNAASLHDVLAALGADMIVRVLGRLDAALAGATAQPAEGVTYARKIDKAESGLDWRASATDLDRAVRAFNPFPGAHVLLAGASVKLWRAQPIDGNGVPGTVLGAGDDGIRVACGRDALLLTELQRAGAKRMTAREFLHGHPLQAGDRFMSAG